jgi:hypothetical protein
MERKDQDPKEEQQQQQVKPEQQNEQQQTEEQDNTVGKVPEPQADDTERKDS